MSITLAQLKREIATYLGYDRDPDNWSATESDDVDAVISSGERELYYASIHEGRVHVWSFLSEGVSATLSQGDSEYHLPSDFVRLVGAVSLSGGSELGVADEGHIRSLLASDPKQRKPETYALVKSAGEPRLIFYPAADQEYALTTRYVREFTSVTSEPPPAEYAELLLAACLAAAERTFRPELGEGTQAVRYQRLLAAAIAHDLELITRQREAQLWQVDELPADLSVTKVYLKRLIGREFGFNPAPGTWTKSQSSEVEEALRTGLRSFYSPPVLDGERYSHEWSFLKGVGHIDFVADQASYDLPEDFAQIEGEMTYEPTASTLYQPISLKPENEVRTALQYNTVSSRPTVMALRPKNGEGPTRYEILVYPKPDQAYRADYRYWRSATALPDDAALPHGGPQHAQTLIDACLSAVESMTEKGANARYQRFLASLRASVGHDRKASASDSLGRSGSTPEGSYHGLNDYLVSTTLIERS